MAGLAALLFGLNVGQIRDRVLRPTGAAQIQSIAVLPLENLSGDPSQEFFADGMTDAVTTDLAQYTALRIISRTSAMQYKGTRKPLPQIAHELNVDAVVEGSVIRSGKVRVGARKWQRIAAQRGKKGMTVIVTPPLKIALPNLRRAGWYHLLCEGR